MSVREGGCEDSGPLVKRLGRGRDVRLGDVGVSEGEAQGAEVEAVRVLAEPGREEGLGLVGNVVEDVVAVGREFYSGEAYNTSAYQGPLVPCSI